MKPQIISKSDLRSNLAKTTEKLLRKPKEELWISDNGDIQIVMVNADHYSRLKDLIARYQKMLFEIETKQAIAEYNAGEFDEFNNIDDLMTDLNDDYENTPDKAI